MPLAPRYSWEQDATSLALSVLLPGGALKNADIYVSDLVVKINSTPYVLLLDLYALVDDTSAVVKATAAENLLRITLQKRDAQLWPTLVYDDSKTALRTRRSESMARRTASDVALSEQRKERRHREEKQTLRAQMAVDDANRQLLTDRKADEKEREERALYESFRTLQATEAQRRAHSSIDECEPPAKPKKHVTFAADFVETDAHAPVAASPKDLVRATEEPQVLEISDDGSFDLPTRPVAAPLSTETRAPEGVGRAADRTESSISSESMAAPPVAAPPKAPAKPVAVHAVPPPRAVQHAALAFTPRVFPTPSRESKAAEEDDWLLKNRQHLQRHKGLRATGAYDISESDPMWLKAKGDDFYRARDYESAANAYTEALALAPTASDVAITCLANRAATNLQLRAFEACIADCSTALSYMPDTRDDINSNSSSPLKHHRVQLKLYVRRGTAYCRTSQFTHAKADYGVALAMDAQDEALQNDFYELVRLEQADALKRMGDTSFSAMDLGAAVAHYTDALALHPRAVASLSNRAACYLLQRELALCVADCTQALALLQQSDDIVSGDNGTSSLAFFTAGPAPGTPKRRAWVVKTLVRRGTAYAAMLDWANAEADYAASVELDPTNESLRSDLQRVQTERANAARCSDALAGATAVTVDAQPKASVAPLKSASEHETNKSDRVATAC